MIGLSCSTLDFVHGDKSNRHEHVKVAVEKLCHEIFAQRSSRHHSQWASVENLTAKKGTPREASFLRESRTGGREPSEGSDQ